MAIRPRNYDEVMRFKRCQQLMNTIPEFDEEMAEKAYQFVGENPENKVCVSGDMLSFTDYAGKVVFSLALTSALRNIEAIEMTGLTLSISRPVSYSGGDGGGSSNNNNNNNNNNNG